MQVVCEGCSAKYSIEDDKVVGKTFKIRCRKCARVLVLRGEPAEAAAAVAAPAEAAPRWHAVQGGRQIGPLDSGELQRRRDAGELDDGSYVWRDGFADWQPLGAIEELRPRAAAAAPAQPRAMDAPAGGADHAGAPGRLRGERAETSALFTLSGLSRLPTPGAGAARAAAPAGATRGEGSGLIDIRTLARSYAPVASSRDGARSGAPAPRDGALDDLPVFPSSGFAAPSVLVPQVAPRQDRRLVVGLAAAAGLVAICATLLLVIALSRHGQQAAATGPTPPPKRVAEIDPPATPRAPSPPVIEPPAAPGPASPAASPTPAAPAVEAQPQPGPASSPAPAPAPAQPSRPGAQPARPSRPASPQVRPPAQPSPAQPARPPAEPAAAKCDQVTCVVNGYDSDCCRALRGGGPLSPPPSPSSSASTLPENLDRAAINDGLATISTRRCGGASSATGLVKAHVKVSAAGAVTSVTVEASPDPALAACVVEQARQGRFKPTQRGGSFSYVWRF